MLKSYKWDGMGWDWDGRKSLKGVILRAPLCGANNTNTSTHSHENTNTKSSTNSRAKLYKNTNIGKNKNTNIDKNTKSNTLGHDT